MVGRPMCAKHVREKQKYDNPLSYWFSVLRQNANHRKVEFLLTLEEFTLFCQRTNYLEKKGKKSGSYSIDRIKSHIGYRLENLQVLTLSQNSKKKWIDLKIQFGRYPTDEEISKFIKDSKLPENPNPELTTKQEINPLEDEIPF